MSEEVKSEPQQVSIIPVPEPQQWDSAPVEERLAWLRFRMRAFADSGLDFDGMARMTESELLEKLNRMATRARDLTKHIPNAS